jgi:hypothetical protein
MLLFNEIQNLNHLTIEEYIVLGASLRTLYEERFQCYNTKRFKTDNSYKTHRLKNSCDNTIKNVKAYHKFDNILFKTCFCNFFNPQVNTLIQVSEHYKEFGKMPESLIEETKMSNKMLEAHNTIQTYLVELRQIQMDKINQDIKNRKI